MFGESSRIGKVDDQVISKLYEMLLDETTHPCAEMQQMNWQA
jgi:hypothetical protein